MEDKIQEIPNLTTLDAAIVSGLLEGKSKAEIARQVNRNPRWVQLRAKSPPIRSALAQATVEVEQSLSYTKQKLQTTIPQAADRIAALVPRAIDVTEKIMEGQIKGFEARTQLAAAALILKLSSTTESSRLVGEERITSNRGLSDAAAADIRRKILGIPD